MVARIVSLEKGLSRSRAPRATAAPTTTDLLVACEDALAFYRRVDNMFEQSSLQLVRAVDGKLSEVVSFIGVDYFRGFGLPEQIAA